MIKRHHLYILTQFGKTKAVRGLITNNNRDPSTAEYLANESARQVTKMDQTESPQLDHKHTAAAGIRLPKVTPTLAYRRLILMERKRTRCEESRYARSLD